MYNTKKSLAIAGVFLAIVLIAIRVFLSTQDEPDLVLGASARAAGCLYELVEDNGSYQFHPVDDCGSIPVPKVTITPTITVTATVSPTSTIEPTATVTPTVPPTSTPVVMVTPYPGAPLCAAHSNDVFHTLWDNSGCHYDHEHGEYPFTQAITDTFPGFNLKELLGNVEIGHTNPSSPMENTHKHGGFKWNVQLLHPRGCAGFEGAATGVNGSVIQFHGFGDYSIEAEARIHSTVALFRQCKVGNPTDYGYVFINQLQDYGQRITPYQGTILPYPNQPTPPFPSAHGPYLSFNCIDLVAPHVAQCRNSLSQALGSSSSSNWTSKVAGAGHSDTPATFRLLWRVRDTYQNFDWNDQIYPFTFVWLCTADGGSTYAPAGCKYNNTTTQVHEIAGVIPTSWDNLSGFDTNPTVGRITADGFLDSEGQVDTVCTEAGGECYPIKLINAFAGTYGSVLVFTPGKGTNIVPYLPERDIYFCTGLPCAEADTGAQPSGWLGQEN